MANTVKLKKYSDVIEEYVAAGAITPGSLLEFDSDGKVDVHSGTQAVALIALENDLEGEGISDDYEADDQVQTWIPYRGDQVNALLTGSAVSKGDFLQSAGDGTLEKYSATLANATLSHKDGSNDGILFTARQAGRTGNDIAIVLETGAVTAGSETVSVSGTVITVTYEDAASSYDQIISAIQGDSDANALVIVEGIGTSSNNASALTETSLSGGEDVEPLQIVAQALEDVDPSGSTVRVEARIV